MISPTDTAASLMEKYGISMTNADGSMKSLAEIMEMLRAQLGGLDEAQQAQAASTIFGLEAMSGMLSIVNASEADYNKLTEAVQNSNGVAKEMAETMSDNLKGRIVALGSKLEGVAIQLSETVLPVVEEIVDTVSSGVEAFANLSSETQSFIVKTGIFVAAAGPVLMVVGEIAESVGSCVELFRNMSTQISTASSRLRAYSVRMNQLANEQAMQAMIAGRSNIAILSAGAAYRVAAGGAMALSFAMKAIPIVGTIAAVGGIVSSFISMRNSAKDSTKEVEGLSYKVEDLQLKVKSAGEISESYVSKIGTILQNSQDSFSDLASTVSYQLLALEYRIKNFSQLSKEGFSDNFKNLASNIRGTIENIDKELVTSTAALLENSEVFSDERKDAIIKNIQAVNSEKMKELDTLSEKAEGLVKKGIDVGLTADEEQELRNTYTRMLAIQEEVQDDYEAARARAKLTAMEFVEIDPQDKEAAIQLVKDVTKASKEAMEQNEINNRKSLERIALLREKGIIDEQEARDMANEENINLEKANNKIIEDRINVLEKMSAGPVAEYAQQLVDIEKEEAKLRDLEAERAKLMQEGSTTMRPNTEKIQQLEDEIATTEKAIESLKKGAEQSGEVAEIYAIATEESIPGLARAIIDELGPLPDQSKNIALNILAGFNTGLSDETKLGELDVTVDAVTARILNGFKGPSGFDEHSPSKKTMKIGEDAGKGIGVGLQKSTGFVISEAVQLADSVIKSLENQLKVAKAQLTLATVAMENEKSQEALEAREKSLSKQYSIQEELVAGLRAEYEKLLKANGEANEKTAEAAEKYANAAKALKDMGNELKEVNLEMALMSEQTEKAQRALSILQAEHNLEDAELDINISEIERLRHENQQLAEEMEARRVVAAELRREYQVYAETYGEFSKEADEAYTRYINEETALAELNQQYQENLKSEEEAIKQMQREQREMDKLIQQVTELADKYQDDMLKAREDYEKRVKEVNENLIKSEEDVTKRYEDELQSRADALADFVGLFDKFTQKYVSGQELLDNLQNQVDVFEGWQGNMDILEGRGVSKDLLDELREMGPSAANEIQALTTLTDEQLDEYVKLWKQKNSMAMNEATGQMSGARQEMYDELARLREETANQLQEYADEWKQTNEDILKTTTESLQSLVDTAADKGEAMILRMAEAIRANLPALLGGMDFGEYDDAVQENTEGFEQQEQQKLAYSTGIWGQMQNMVALNLAGVGKLLQEGTKEFKFQERLKTAGQVLELNRQERNVYSSQLANLSTLQSFVPRWGEIGRMLGNSLLEGIRSTQSEISRYMDEISSMRSSAMSIDNFNTYASGTRSAARGWAVVGEEGPELLYLNGGERILPNADFAKTYEEIAASLRYSPVDYDWSGESKQTNMEIDYDRLAKALAKELKAVAKPSINYNPVNYNMPAISPAEQRRQDKIMLRRLAFNYRGK